MLEIPCPFCGPRPEVEFRCGGEADIRRPADPDRCSDRAWTDYLWNRTNPKGVHRERWWHVHGCRRWFVVSRHTVSDTILAVEDSGQTAHPQETAADG